MAKKIAVSYDFLKNEIQNFRTHNLAAAPSTPALGQRYYDTVTNCEYYWNGAWIPCDARLRSGIPLSNLATDPLARANHTGTQTAATISDFATATRAVTAFPIGNLTTDPLARANHTGTQTASTISDLATVVKAYRHDEFAQPTAAIAMNGQKFTGLGAPTAGSNDSARIIDVENAVNSAASGIDSKPSVRIVSVSNIASLTGLTAIDGVTPIAGDRILLTGQTTPVQNGVYVAAAGAWARAIDADVTGEITPGAFWFVEEGTTYGKTQWRCNNTGAITLGTTGITIIQFGASVAYTGGAGILLTGSDFSIGAGTGISVLADSVAVDTTVVVRKYSMAVGDGALSSFTVTHSLNNQDVMVQVREVSTNAVIDCDIVNSGVDTVVVTFTPTVPTVGQYRVVCQG